MQNLEKLGQELERMGKTGEIKALAESENGIKLSRMLDAKEVEAAARNGDAEAIRKILAAVLSTREGKNLVGQVEKLMGGK